MSSANTGETHSGETYTQSGRVIVNNQIPQIQTGDEYPTGKQHTVMIHIQLIILIHFYIVTDMMKNTVIPQKISSLYLIFQMN